ncbi:flagellar basal body rod protein FlgB [Paenibacillus sediminis]|uniref:Flagellar basal body rod protein FlgB n=1 Tax=Paenibacillus sediminis TaxID=664909 RepID=A0ABS4H1T1_9BACL|nr:flagellar basal body rod protein FlgB [Paenibacillus sediminis]MBP1936431.1 flagellar basal-body rod protein FlgB [Paenibacillus sediminis]
MELLTGTSFNRLQGAIKAADIRQDVISNNIANVDTPYFKRSDVSFESLLQDAMNNSTLEGRRTDSRHFVIGRSSMVPEPSVTEDQSTSMNNNSNNVDIDQEMTNLAENQLRYNSYIEQLNYQIKMMRTAVQGS